MTRQVVTRVDLGRCALAVFALWLVAVGVRADVWTLRVVGNMTFGEEWTPILEREGSEYPFEQMARFLADADLTMGFLEGGIPRQRDLVPRVENALRSSPLVADSLRFAGFDAVSISSPHLMDYGLFGLTDTREIFDAMGIGRFGAGENATLARMYGLAVAGDMTVACLAYLHGVHKAHAGQQAPGASPALPSAVRADVSNAIAGADVALVFFHWGDSFGNEVDGKQRLIAHMAIDAGATAVFGTRDQTWQGVEVYRDRPIFYSLSDFVRGVNAKRNGRVVIPTIVFDHSLPMRIELNAVRVDAAVRPGDNPAPRLQPELLTGRDAIPPIDAFARLCDELGTQVVQTESGGTIFLEERP